MNPRAAPLKSLLPGIAGISIAGLCIAQFTVFAGAKVPATLDSSWTTATKSYSKFQNQNPMFGNASK